jgi:hypothetical protein
MGQTAGEIERHIQEQRMEFAENASELQGKVKRAVDWRYQVHEHPMTMLGLAFGGGVLIAALAPSRRWRARDWEDAEWASSAKPEPISSGTRASRRSSPGAQYQKHQAADMFDNVKGALIGLAASKIKGFFDEVLPDFREHYSKTEQGKDRSRANATRPEFQSGPRDSSRNRGDFEDAPE